MRPDWLHFSYGVLVAVRQYERKMRASGFGGTMRT